MVGLGASEGEKTKYLQFSCFKGENSSKGVFQSEKLMKFRCQAEFQKFWLFVDDIFFIMSISWKWHLISERGSLNFIQYLSKKLNFKSKKFLTLEEKTSFFGLLRPPALPKMKIWQIHWTSIYFGEKNY